MPPKRMNRHEFFGKVDGLSEDQSKKALWTLCWRGSAQMRERMERELAPAEDEARKRSAAMPPDPDSVLFEVREFAELARAGAYLAGDRRVSPQKRSRWRVTFRRPSGGALAAPRAGHPPPAGGGGSLVVHVAFGRRGGCVISVRAPVGGL